MDTNAAAPARAYGWKPQLPEYKDIWLSPPPAEAAQALPPTVDLTVWLPPVYDQEDLGACTAHASSSAMLWALIKQNKGSAALNGYLPSRLEIYYNSRAAEHTIQSDAGAALRDVIRVLAKLGAADERLWPYDTKKFKVKPTPGASKDGLKHLVSRYTAVVQSAAGIKGCLATVGPVVFGFTVYSPFEGGEIATHGLVPLPTQADDRLGGHAVLAVGYDDNKKFPDGSVGGVLCRNSWGPKWGLGGNFWLPYAYIFNPNLASDFWNVQAVTQSIVAAH